MIFLLRFLLRRGADANLIFSLKSLILSALLYAGAALSKYSLLQDIRYSPADHRWYLFGDSWWVV